MNPNETSVVLRRENANTAEVIPPCSTPKKESKRKPKAGEQTTAQTKQTDTAIVKAPDSVETLDTYQASYFAKHALSPATQREVAESTEFIVSRLSAAAANLMEVGTRLLELKESLKDDFNGYLEVLNSSGILSQGKSWVLMQQASVFASRIKHELTRKWFMAIGSGSGIVVRVPPTKAEKDTAKANNQKPPAAKYELSQSFSKALEVCNSIQPKGKLDDERAEIYVRKVLTVASKLRAADRSKPDQKAQIVKRFNDFSEWAGSKLEKHEELVYDCMEDLLRALVTETTDLTRLGDLTQALNEAWEGKEKMTKGDGKRIKPASSQSNAAQVA